MFIRDKLKGPVLGMVNDITRQIVVGLQRLHSLGIVHGDLKPGKLSGHRTTKMNLTPLERGEREFKHILKLEILFSLNVIIIIRQKSKILTEKVRFCTSFFVFSDLGNPKIGEG